MSFIDTIALPLFAFLIGLGFVIFVIAHVGREVTKARANLLAQERNVRLERQAYQLITALVVATDSLEVTLTPELNEELMKVYYQIDTQKELSR